MKKAIIFLLAATAFFTACNNNQLDDELFIKQEGYSATQIYRYDCQTGKTSVFATTSRSLAKYMTATPDGLLYVPTTDFYHIYTEVYRISDGTRMTGVESRIGKVAGDGGIVSTYSFAE